MASTRLICPSDAAVQRSVATSLAPAAAARNTKTAAAGWRSLRLQRVAGAIAFFPTMRRFLFLLVIVFALRCSAEDLPAYRPALIGKSPEAVINRIDENLLLKAGQKKGLIMFFALVDKDGTVKSSNTYRGTPDSKLLEQEVQRALTNAKMTPAIRNHEPVAVFYYATVVFQVVDDKPRLRIYANQEASELRTENDFVGPQPCLGADSKFDGLHFPEGLPVQVNGLVELSLKIDAAGNLQEAKVEKEDPPLLGFGDAAMADFANAKFIPAFRNGQPVACQVVLPVYYVAQD
jgi:Gram-negative bacterial TonB protein C-terminal